MLIELMPGERPAALRARALSRSEEQVRETFHSLQGTVNVLGRTNREVPLMEYP